MTSRPNLLAIGMGIEVTFYALVGALVLLGVDGIPLIAAVFPGSMGNASERTGKRTAS